jgi:outer membrane protein assembly factor BamB
MKISRLSLPVAAAIAGSLFTASAMLCGTAVAAPALSLSLAAGPPTTTITVSGTGFSASALVDIYFDMTDLCLSIASGTGSVSCAIKVPKEAQPQTLWISAVQRNTSTGAQKAFVVRTDWTQFHGRDAKHTGFNPFENTLNTSNVANLDILWQASIGSLGTNGTPAVAGGKVYIDGLDGKLYAFSATKGTAVAGFPKTLGGQVFYSSPAVGQGNVYIGTNAPDDKLYAFNANTGATAAGYPVTLGGAIYASPALYNGNVYVGCFDGKIYAFDAATGTTLAGFPVTAGTIDATVSAANGRIYVGSYGNGQFYAFDAVTGAGIPGYPITTGDSIESTAALVSGQVFFGSDDRDLYGLHRSDGALPSGFPVATGGFVASSPATDGGQMIVGSSDGKTYSFTAADGSLRWSKSLDDQVRGSPIIANGVVYVNSQKSLFALDASTGAILWRAGVHTAPSLASPAVADGIVFIGSSDGNLYAFSVNGLAPAKRLPGGELGIKPALSSLRPDQSLKVTQY